MHPLWLLLLPELHRIAPPERPHALKCARHEELDVPELIGAAFAVVAVAFITERMIPAAASTALAFLLNLAVALPLLALLVAPLHVRRLRRGLRAQLKADGHAA
jgi:hypothetical protein